MRITTHPPTIFSTSLCLSPIKCFSTADSHLLMTPFFSKKTTFSSPFLSISEKKRIFVNSMQKQICIL